MLIISFFLATGLALLIFGAQWLLRGSMHLAGHFRISPLIVGLTIVAFGTSAPELATSLISAYYGRGDIALGNVVGSNIVNIGLILGLTALFVPVKVSNSLNSRYIPFLIVASLVLVWFSRSLAFSRPEGLVFLVLFLVFFWYAVKKAKSEESTGGAELAAEELQTAGKGPQLALNTLLIVAGLVMLGFGADLFVRGAVDIARVVGLSEAVIGVTIVALGTSLPELAASVLAAVRKMPGVALGNIVGSNLFNTLAVIGIPASLVPYTFSSPIANVSIPVMLGFTVVLMVFALTHRMVSRWEGAFLLLITALYWSALLIFEMS